jgi:hypothetical protein
MRGSNFKIIVGNMWSKHNSSSEVTDPKEE